MGKSLSNKYEQKQAIQKTAKTTGDLVENKIAKKITKAALNSTHQDPIKLAAPAQIDETSMQLIGISKEIYIHEKDNNKLLMKFYLYNIYTKREESNKKS